MCVLGQFIASAVEAVFLKAFCSVLGKTLKSSCTDPHRDEERNFPPLFHKTQRGSGTLRTGGDLGASWDGSCLPGGGRTSFKLSVLPLFLKFHDQSTRWGASEEKDDGCHVAVYELIWWHLFWDYPEHWRERKGLEEVRQVGARRGKNKNAHWLLVILFYFYLQIENAGNLDCL